MRCHDVNGDGSHVVMGVMDDADVFTEGFPADFPSCLAVCDNFVIGNKQFKPRNVTDVRI